MNGKCPSQMTHNQMHDFAAGPEKSKPFKVGPGVGVGSKIGPGVGSGSLKKQLTK
jgi:hypothetical protein